VISVVNELGLFTVGCRQIIIRSYFLIASLLQTSLSKENVVLQHEHQVKANGEEPETKLGWISKDGLPVICVGKEKFSCVNIITVIEVLVKCMYM